MIRPDKLYEYAYPAVTKDGDIFRACLVRSDGFIDDVAEREFPTRNEALNIAEAVFMNIVEVRGYLDSPRL